MQPLPETDNKVKSLENALYSIEDECRRKDWGLCGATSPEAVYVTVFRQVKSLRGPKELWRKKRELNSRLADSQYELEKMREVLGDSVTREES